MNIGRLFGINIRIDISWLFVFAFVAWSLSSNVGPLRTLNVSPLARAVLAVVTTLLFFASVLVHELAHSLLARARGVPIKGITLMIFGGVSQFEGDPQSAPSAGWIAAVGPLTSLVLGAMFYGLAVVAGTTTPFGTAFAYLAAANVILAIFNLLPAFPLDGGRVLHAVLWRITGDRVRATRIAVRVSQVFAWSIIAFGIWETLEYGIGGGLWLTFIGWFLLQAGAAEEFQATLNRALQGHPVIDLAARPAGAIPADTSINHAFDALVQATDHALPVMLGDRFLGIVTVAAAASAQAEGNGEAYVTSIMMRAEDIPSVGPRTSAIDALRELARSPAGVVPIVDEAGTLHGFVSRAGIMNWIAHERENDLRAMRSRLGG
ncbi:MAG TPA: site-2 protease family protein [Candidatus Binatia bacterium]|nr:site-2 protease family protein [Candidatus Binatia bacterium]